MHQLLKKIPKNQKATSIQVMFGEEMFATIPMSMVPPRSKAYIPVVMAIDNVIDPMVRGIMDDSGLGGILSAMAGELDEQTTEDFVSNSEIMQNFSIKYI